MQKLDNRLVIVRPTDAVDKGIQQFVCVNQVGRRFEFGQKVNLPSVLLVFMEDKESCGTPRHFWNANKENTLSGTKGEHDIEMEERFVVQYMDGRPSATEEKRLKDVEAAEALIAKTLPEQNIEDKGNAPELDLTLN